MGDVVYPGVYIVRANKAISELEVRKYVHRWIGQDKALYRNGDFCVKIFKKRDNQTSVLISGIMLPFNEIRVRFGSHQMMDYSVFIQTQDFGVRRKPDGEFGKSSLELHNRFKEAHGHLKIIDIFTEQVSELYGPLADLTTTAYFGATKDNIDRFELRRTGHVLLYGNSVARDKLRSLKPDEREEYTQTEIVYLYPAEVFQTATRFNKDKGLCKSGKEFITGNDGFVCQIQYNFGLNSAGKILHIKDIVRQYGYLPFETLYKDIVSSSKLTSLETICFLCGSGYTLLGISPYFSWFAATCDCDKNGTLDKWNKETFFRLVPSKQHNTRIIKDKLVRFIPALMPLSENVAHFKKSVMGAYNMECVHNERVLYSKQANGKVISSEPLEDHNLPNGTSISYVIKLRVLRSSICCEQGSQKVKNLILVPLEAEGTAENISYKQVKDRGTISAHVKTIQVTQDSSQHCEITVVATTAKCQKILMDELQFVKIVPQYNTFEQRAVEKSVEKWEGFQLHRSHPLPTTRATLEYAQAHSTITHNSKPYHVWCIHIETLGAPEIWHLLETHIHDFYVGIDLQLPVIVKNMRYARKETCRVISIHRMPTKGNSLISSNSCKTLMKAICVLPANCRVPQRGDCEVNLWAICPEQKLKENHLTSGIPAGEEDNHKRPRGTQGHDGILANLQQEEEQLFLVEKDSKDRSTRLDIYVNNRLTIPTCRAIATIIAEWRVRPHKDLSILDFLLQPSILVQHHKEVDNNLFRCTSHVSTANIVQMKTQLNESQKHAIEKMLKCRLSILQGPPGTGKTTTLAMGLGILYLSEGGLVILCCATNKAADVAYDKISFVNSQYGLRMNVIQIISDSWQSRTRDSSNKNKRLLHNLVADHRWNKQKGSALLTSKETSKDGGMSMSRKEKQHLLKHRNRVTNDVLVDAHIIITTVSTAADGRLDRLLKLRQQLNLPLSAVVLDESSLVTLPSVIPVLCFSPRRLWIIGDHQQLRPVIRNESAKTACLDISILETLMCTPYVKNNYEDVFTMLNIQYRMPRDIATVVSKLSYQNALKSSAIVLQRDYRTNWRTLLETFPELQSNNMSVYTYAGCHEIRDKESASKCNPREIEITRFLLAQLYNCGVSMDSVCVISMYEFHCVQVRKMLTSLSPEYNGVKAITVDASQGDEFPIVILNFVRSNSRHHVGFVKDLKRLNVAISRPTDFLLMVADTKTLRGSEEPEMKAFMRSLSKASVNVVHCTPRV